MNVSEGRRHDLLALFDSAAGTSLRHRHSDSTHHRSVFTLVNERAALASDVRSLATSVLTSLDLRAHEGVHPRLGVLDVVPFVALKGATRHQARDLRDECAAWLADTFALPVFLYGRLPGGTERTLPEVRREAFRSLTPDYGPSDVSPLLGASAVGEREVLVAWNISLTGVSLTQARAIATALRRPEVRALAFEMDGAVQVSCNLVAPLVVTPSMVLDEVLAQLPHGVTWHCELVGLAPKSLFEVEEPRRWDELDLDPSRALELA